MKKLLLLFCVLFFSYASEVLVAAAANTTYAMPEIIKAFNKQHPNVRIKLILSSSGKLTAQIVKGAPYDIFMSANMKYPDFLYKVGFAKTKPTVYAKGALALFSVKKIDLNNFKKALFNAKIIAIANSKTAPYGKAAIEAMKKAGIYNKVLSKLIFAETVTSVIPYTINEADIGIVAKSSLCSPKMSKYKNFAAVPSNLYNPIKQGIALLSDNKDAKTFYRFILSNKAKEIFKKYGYIY